MNNLIASHFKNKDLDIRKKAFGYSRFMDQKVTPDVLCFISDCILNYTSGSAKTFTIKDIWNSPYFRKNVTRHFGKPSPDDKRTLHEYDKFVAQPIKTLLFSQILEVQITGKQQHFTLKNIDLLNFISIRSENAYIFLYYYITKVLQNSGFYNNLESYRDSYLSGRLSKEKFSDLKKKFTSFIIGNTEIKKEFEPKRIFPKILNIFAAEQRIPGTISGRMSKYPFLPSDLIYNRTNFRDKKKYKGVTRQEAGSIISHTKEYEKLPYRVSKAKAKIKKLHTESEVKDQWANGSATQVHHIFPEHEFKQISDRLENLIRLTPTQHNTKAHPNNNTQIIDKGYQYICLEAKIDSVEKSVQQGKFDYSRESLIGVINTGLKTNLSYTISFNNLRKKIKKIYRELN